ncbi:TetR/AcrR family transcriptional regulator [Nocardia sp. NPDC058379]|uniref:TetR/AcrR family transcriptional regulator n=1 Tax=unclassified Nocardia TaxID=2637762 RepID=UPI00366A0088
MDASIAAAVRAVLDERGYAGSTVDAVATRAGVSKATIYRRYATKQEMTFAVLLHDLRAAAPADTGSLSADLRALTTQIATQVRDAGAGNLTGLLADIRADPRLRIRFATTFLPVERRIITTVLDRAIARGELTRAPDPAVVQALLLGPLYSWLIMLDENPTRATELTGLVATVVTEALTTNLLPTRRSPAARPGTAPGGPRPPPAPRASPWPGLSASTEDRPEQRSSMNKTFTAVARVAAAGVCGLAFVAVVGSGTAQAAPQDCRVERDFFGASATCQPDGGSNYVLHLDCFGFYANGPFPMYTIGSYTVLSYPFEPSGQRISAACTGMGPGVVAAATNAYVEVYRG